MSVTVRTTNEDYLIGCDSFTAQLEDNPDCVPFYRAWRGMENVLGKDTLSRWHHLFHEAICWGSNKPLEEQFDTIVAHARYMCNRGGRTEEPRYSYSYNCPPSEPTDDDARKFFNSEYKRAFPDKRANSKHANALWIEKREQALSILREQYQAELKRYNDKEECRETENRRRKEEWISAAWTLAEFENVVRSL